MITRGENRRVQDGGIRGGNAGKFAVNDGRIGGVSAARRGAARMNNLCPRERENAKWQVLNSLCIDATRIACPFHRCSTCNVYVHSPEDRSALKPVHESSRGARRARFDN